MAKGTQDNSVNYQTLGNYIEIDGFKVHYYEEGQGQPLLFIHGRGQFMFTWRKNIKEFAKHFRVIAVDLIGYGYSDKPELEYSIRDFCEFTRAFLDILGIEKTHLVACSEGGIYALDFMMEYPERVDKAILVSPGGLTRYSPLWDRLMGFKYIGELSSFFLGIKRVRKQLLEAFFDETNVTEDMIEQVYKPLAGKEARNVLLASARAWDDSPVFENLSSIQHSILIVWGENDKWHPASIAKEFQNVLTNSRLEIIRNCGHLAHEEKFREFNHKSLYFLTGQEMERQRVIS